MVIAVGASEAKTLLAGQGLKMKPVLGGFVLGIFLFAFGMANENLATRFCVLVAVAAVLVNGKSLFGLLGKLT